MSSSREHAKHGKTALPPEVFRVSAVNHADRGKSRRSVTIFHVLQVEGTGSRAVGRAAAQRGLIQREQQLTSGVGRGAIAHRLSTGALCRVLLGVFSLGHEPLAPLALETAVVLWIGRDCVISHTSAASIWGLVPGSDTVDVTVLGRDVRARPGVRTRRVRDLDPRDVRLRERLPVTSPARTLIDLAATVPASARERALAEAQVQRLIRAEASDLAAAMSRVPGRAGLASLRRVLEAEGRSGATRSDAERRLRKLLADVQLPRPETNIELGGYEVDFLWRPKRLVIEVDGHQFHGHRRAFERDRKRDQALVASGYRVIRVTWRQLVDEPLALVARIAQPLGV
jgi:very-short-patch-repair endonuclease